MIGFFGPEHVVSNIGGAAMGGSNVQNTVYTINVQGGTQQHAAFVVVVFPYKDGSTDPSVPTLTDNFNHTWQQITTFVWSNNQATHRSMMVFAAKNQGDTNYSGADMNVTITFPVNVLGTGWALVGVPTLPNLPTAAAYLPVSQITFSPVNSTGATFTATLATPIKPSNVFIVAAVQVSGNNPVVPSGWHLIGTNKVTTPLSTILVDSYGGTSVAPTGPLFQFSGSFSTICGWLAMEMITL